MISPPADETLGAPPSLVAVPGQGRLSAVTVHGPPQLASQASSQAPSTPWSQAPIAPGGDTEVCVACQGSGLLNAQVNLRLFRLIGSGQLRLAGQTTPVAPTTPAPAAAPSFT